MKPAARRIFHAVLVAIALSWLFLGAAVIAGAQRASAASGGPKLAQHHGGVRQTTLDAVSRTVMCPTCDTTLDRSNSPAADAMRVWIRAAIAQGWTKDEIRDGLVAEYGGDEGILATPRARGIGAFAWYVPVAIVAVLALIGLVLVRRWRRSAPARDIEGASA